MPLTLKQRLKLNKLAAERLAEGEEVELPKEQQDELSSEVEQEKEKALKEIWKPSAVSPTPSAEDEARAEQVAKQRVANKYSTGYAEPSSPGTLLVDKPYDFLGSLAKKVTAGLIAGGKQSPGIEGKMKPQQPSMAPDISTFKWDKPSTTKDAQAELDFLTGRSKEAPTPSVERVKELSPSPENQAFVQDRINTLKDMVARGRAAAGAKVTEKREPEPEPEEPTAPTAEKEEAPDASDLVTQFASSNEYVDNSDMPGEEKQDLTSRLNSLEEKYDKAIEAYKAGADRVEVAKAIEKIAQGLALWGAGAYGKKHGVDAVSGLKFSSTDWSTRMTALEKELDAAEKKYTKGIEAIKKEQEASEEAQKAEQKQERATAAATAKEAKEKQTLERTAGVSKIKSQISDIEDAIKNIDKLAGKADAKDFELQATNLANSLGVPTESLRVPGTLYGTNFDKNKALETFDQAKKALQSKRNQARDILFQVQSGGSSAQPAQPAPGITPEEEARRQYLERKRRGEVK